VDHWFLQPHPNKSFTNEYTLVVNYLTLKTSESSPVIRKTRNQTEIQQQLCFESTGCTEYG
jgi:hypothetical protein